MSEIYEKGILTEANHDKAKYWQQQAESKINTPEQKTQIDNMYCRQDKNNSHLPVLKAYYYNPTDIVVYRY